MPLADSLDTSSSPPAIQEGLFLWAGFWKKWTMRTSSSQVNKWFFAILIKGLGTVTNKCSFHCLLSSMLKGPYYYILNMTWLYCQHWPQCLLQSCPSINLYFLVKNIVHHWLHTRGLHSEVLCVHSYIIMKDMRCARLYHCYTESCPHRGYCLWWCPDTWSDITCNGPVKALFRWGSHMSRRPF